jgi:hypothetical protein
LRAVLIAAPLLLVAGGAAAHDGDHSCMPHMVTASASVRGASLEGTHPLLAGDVAEGYVPGVGVSATYALAPFPELELRLRFQYMKPLPDRAALRDGLHEIRGMLGTVFLAPLVPTTLDLAVGFEAGVVDYRLTQVELDVPFDADEALGWSLGASIGLRGWVTWHTGFWGELRAGHTHARDDGFALRSTWPIELALGWADRF